MVGARVGVYVVAVVALLTSVRSAVATVELNVDHVGHVEGIDTRCEGCCCGEVAASSDVVDGIVVFAGNKKLAGLREEPQTNGAENLGELREPAHVTTRGDIDNDIGVLIGDEQLCAHLSDCNTRIIEQIVVREEWHGREVATGRGVHDAVVEGDDPERVGAVAKDVLPAR